MRVLILEKEKEIYVSDNAKYVTLPSVSGEITVYPEHMSIITLMTNGSITVAFEENSIEKYKTVEIKEGIFSFKNNEAVLLVQM